MNKRKRLRAQERKALDTIIAAVIRGDIKITGESTANLLESKRKKLFDELRHQREHGNDIYGK